MSETESFEDARISAQAMIYDCDIPLLDRLKAAHEREIRDVSQQQYDRGFNDGRHSMDAEHRAIAMRLRRLPLDGGSHENLSQIARAVYHSDWGWTKGACAALRDELVRLMGGVSDDTCDSQCRGACTDSDGGDSGEQEVTDERLADDCAADSRGGDGGGDLHMDRVTDEERRRVVAELRRLDAEDGKAYLCGSDIAHAIELDYGDTFLGRLADLIGGDRPSMVAYDVLWNERREAVCELRKMRSCKEDYFAPELVFDGFYDALGCRAETGGDLGDQMCDRLIHLLGGDQPSGIDVLREMDVDGTRPNDDPSTSITDELREYIAVTWDDSPYAKQIPMELRAIADRIDERAKHDRDSDQLRIEKLVKQRDKLQAKLDTCYRRKGAEDVVRGIALGTYSMTEGIEKLERIYGGD